MKTLHSLAFYAMVTPAIALGAGTVLAEQSVDSQRQGAQSYQGAEQSGTEKAADRLSARDQSRMQNKGYMSAVPANSRQVSELMGVNVHTLDDQNIGSVSDLIVDKDGQIVAIVVGVGGFLGMGEKNVAIGWGHVTQSGTAEERELRIDVSRDDLLAAPEFEERK